MEWLCGRKMLFGAVSEAPPASARSAAHVCGARAARQSGEAEAARIWWRLRPTWVTSTSMRRYLKASADLMRDVAAAGEG